MLETRDSGRLDAGELGDSAFPCVELPLCSAGGVGARSVERLARESEDSVTGRSAGEYVSELGLGSRDARSDVEFCFFRKLGDCFGLE